MSDTCGNTISNSYISPNKEFKIVIFERNCGATTDFSTQVSLVKSDIEIRKDDDGNIFSADRDGGKAETDENGNIYLKAEWLDNNNILINYDSKIRIFKKELKQNGITISYRKNYR